MPAPLGFGFFAHGKSKGTQQAAQSIIAAVGKADGVGVGKPEGAAARIDQALLGVDGRHFGNEHIMAAQGQDLTDPAFDVQGRLADERRADLLGCK